jgi:hypothetical protein
MEIPPEVSKQPAEVIETVIWKNIGDGFHRLCASLALQQMKQLTFQIERLES